MNVVDLRLFDVYLSGDKVRPNAVTHPTYRNNCTFSVIAETLERAAGVAKIHAADLEHTNVVIHSIQHRGGSHVVVDPLILGRLNQR